MVWCSYCARDQQAERDDINGFTCCTGCGRVLDDNIYGSDPTFTKTAGGQSQVEGNFVKDGQSSFGRLGAGAGRILGYQSDSHEKTLAKGKHEIVEILERLSIRPRDDTATQAHRFYTIALERNFTRGRRTQHVAASCIYIVCRENSKPYMLIDFSDCLQTNVYVLGAVFLQLCNLLRLEEQPFMQKPVDPSLFIHRFADRLRFGKKMHAVSNTALRLVASMKRDWMQTGRRPSGICGAALFISAHMHGFERSKGDVVSVVHICEATLKKRLVEFECTESGSLTAEEFEVKGQEMEAQLKAAVYVASSKGSKSLTEILCEHKETGSAHFSHGLCRPCYEEFVRVSGGMQGGSAPPAFQRAELQRMQAVRDQLKQQGLESDEDDEEGIPMQKLRAPRVGVPPNGKALVLGTSNRSDSAHLPSSGRGQGRGVRGRGRGRGRGGRGRARGSISTIEANLDDRSATEQLHAIDSQHGRVRARERGKDGTIIDAVESTSKGNRLPETGGQLELGRIRGRGRGVQKQGASIADNWNEENEGEASLGEVDVPVKHVEASNSSEFSSREDKAADKRHTEDALDTPDDNDVLWPVKFPAKRSNAVRKKNVYIEGEEVVIASKSSTVPAMDNNRLDNVVREFAEPQVHNPESVAALRSQTGIAIDSVDNGTEIITMDSLRDNCNGAPPESLDAVKVSGCLSTAGAQLKNDLLKLGDESRSDGLVDEDSLSNIDDDELVGYMNNDEEVRLKTIIWTEMNKEYLQEQEAKEAALTALEEARAAAIAAAASNSASAAELAAAAAAAVAQMKKDRKQKRVDDAKRPPAQSAAEATRLMLESKRLSTKVDYAVLAKLFDTNESENNGNTVKRKQDEDADSEAPDMSSKRTRFSSQAEGSQGDSVITQIREVDSKEGSVHVQDINEEDEAEMDEELEALAEDGEVEVEGIPYDYDEADDYYDEY